MNSFSSPRATEPDFSHLDTAEDIYLDAEKWGLVDELRTLLLKNSVEVNRDECRLACHVISEIAAASNRDLAVDLFLHLSGISGFEPSSPSDYARKHNCSCEWFLQEAGAMRERLAEFCRARECSGRAASPNRAATATPRVTALKQATACL